MRVIIIFPLWLALISTVYSQTNKSKVVITNMVGETVSLSEIVGQGHPVLINFWASWCKPCLTEMEAINDLYEDWQDETGVKIIAISVDDSRSSAKVKPLINGKGWEFDFYLDTNQDAKRALNATNIPYSIIFNKDGEIVWRHAGYTPGGEDEIYSRLSELQK